MCFFDLGIYEVFCGNKNFYFGKQPEHFPGCPETVSICDDFVTDDYKCELELSCLVDASVGVCDAVLQCKVFSATQSR